MFYIEVKGQKHYYNSMEAILAAAGKIFEKTGIVVGIYRTES